MINRHAVHGTPADCVRLALFALDVKPDLVLSGINAGGNMGQDIVISGTVAAAREAAYHGVRSLALSHYMIRELRRRLAAHLTWIADILRETHPQDHPAQVLFGTSTSRIWPARPDGSAATHPEATLPARPLAFDRWPTTQNEHGYAYSASYASRPRDPGSDVDACFGGNVAISLLHV
jgi:5'-nucleotidase